MVLLALALAGSSRAEVATVPRRVRTFVVGASHEGSLRWVPATLVAGQRATISTRLSASVRSVAVAEGARVKTGQLLLSLSDSDLRAQLRAARAGLEAAALQEKRMAVLVADRAATPVELGGARLQRAQAEAAVGVVKTSLQYTSIRAPFGGRIQSKRVSAGDLVSPGQPLLELEGSGFELQATLSEEELSGIAPGGQMEFEADGRGGQAEVIAVSAGGDEVAHRQLLRARILGSLERLRSGSFARVALPRRGGGGIWVPRAALVERGDLTGVFVARDGRAELRWLALGDADGDRVPVRAGLAAGEAVIEDPAAAVDGEPVEVAHGR
jgi:RND family efflux transporter MFP subunit